MGRGSETSNVLYGATKPRGPHLSDPELLPSDALLGKRVCLNRPGSPLDGDPFRVFSVHQPKDGGPKKYTVKVGASGHETFEASELTAMTEDSFASGDRVLTPDGIGIFECTEDGGGGGHIYNVVLEAELGQKEPMAHEFGINEITDLPRTL